MSKNKKRKITIVIVVLIGIAIYLFQTIKEPIAYYKSTESMIREARQYLAENLSNEEISVETHEIIYEDTYKYHIDDSIKWSNVFSLKCKYPYKLAEVYLTYGEDTYVIVFENDGKGNMQIIDMIKNRAY